MDMKRVIALRSVLRDAERDGAVDVVGIRNGRKGYPRRRRALPLNGKVNVVGGCVGSNEDRIRRDVGA